MRRSVVVVFALLGCLFSMSVSAGSPQSIHYQGYLTDDLGEPVNDTVEMEFKLYDVEVAGEAFWHTDGSLAVDIENGVFRVTLAPVTAGELAAGEVWLGITVVPSEPGEPSQEMSPRLKVLSVPYALVAEHAISADFAGEAAAVTDIDFATFATGDDVEGVLGVCIQEADLTEALAGYCEAPCYGDADVEGLLVDGGYVTEIYLTDNSYLTTSELDVALAGVCQAPCYGDSNVDWLLDEGGYVTQLFLTENGYVTTDALAQWVEENVVVDGITEEDLAAYLSAGGYLTEEELLWFLAEAGYPDADAVVLRDGTAALEGDWDVGGNQLLNLVVHNAASDAAPADPTAGQLWWDTTEKLVKVFDGAEWKVVGGGDVAFASDSDTLDGLDSTAFELAGAVAAHEAGNPHLSQVQFAALTGGTDSIADAYHTHESIGGGLPNINPDLLTSVFTKKYCSTDTPMTAPTDFGQVVSTIQVSDAGTIIAVQLEVQVTHGVPDTLVPTLTGPNSNVVISDAFELDATGDWTFDLTGQFNDTESSGDWELEILDMTSGNGVVTLGNWCVTVEYMSSEKLEVNGSLYVAGTDVIEQDAFMLNAMLSFALDGAEVTNQDSLKLDLFGSDTATELGFMEYDSASDRYVAIDMSGLGSYYVDIHTDSLSGVSGLVINDCETKRVHSDGTGYIHRLYCGNGSTEEQRAKAMKTLFYGTNGSDPRVIALEGLTQLRSSDSRDVGKTAHFLRITCSPDNHLSGGLTGGEYNELVVTFGDTVGNTNCSVWSRCHGRGDSSYGKWGESTCEMPNSTVINSASSGTSDETGKDTSLEEADNPEKMLLRQRSPGTGGTTYGGGQSPGISEAILLAKGAISVEYSETWEQSEFGHYEVDFYVDHSIPAFEAAEFSGELNPYLITDSQPISNEPSGIIKSLHTLVGANTITTEVSFDDGVNWQEVTQSTLFKIVNTGTAGKVKFTIDRQSSTEQSYIEGYAYYYK